VILFIHNRNRLHLCCNRPMPGCRSYKPERKQLYNKIRNLVQRNFQAA